ncbi:MAG: hypothetical protein FJX84_02195 [Bacteroidetes bacterium]|nr:hypothetical protein [Bacteroidota bacterium]
MIATLNSKTESPEVADPRDIRKGYIAAAVTLAILFIVLFFFTYEKLDPPPMDMVVKTETTLEELELKELVVEPGSGGATSPIDASPSPSDAQQVLTGKSNTSTTQTGKPYGTGKGDNPFGQGVGEKGSSVFGRANGPDDQSDGTSCDNTPINLNTIINQLKKNVPVTKPTSATVTIKIKADGSVSSANVTGLGAAEASVERKIQEIVMKSQCTKCNGKNKNSRTYTFSKIVLKQE